MGAQLPFPADRQQTRRPSCLIYNLQCWIWSFASPPLYFSTPISSPPSPRFRQPEQPEVVATSGVACYYLAGVPSSGLAGLGHHLILGGCRRELFLW
jgi:hypothetical protein